MVRRTSTADCDLNPAFSPDGGAIAFHRRPTRLTCTAAQGTADLYVIEPGRRERRLTSTPDRDEKEAAWAPDARALVYASGPGDETEIHVMTPDGRRSRRLTDGWRSATEPTWGHLPGSIPALPADQPEP
jgi:Tol biopolymer transport system component